MSLDTPEGRWKHLLTLWHDRNLPTPQHVTVHASLQVCLPNNSQAAVDAWAKALGCRRASLDEFGWESGQGLYEARNAPGGLFVRVFCTVDEPVAPVVSADALTMLGGERP